LQVWNQKFYLALHCWLTLLGLLSLASLAYRGVTFSCPAARCRSPFNTLFSFLAFSVMAFYFLVFYFLALYFLAFSVLAFNFLAFYFLTGDGWSGGRASAWTRSAGRRSSRPPRLAPLPNTLDPWAIKEIILSSPRTTPTGSSTLSCWTTATPSSGIW
jgi:hypothetical protein